MDSPQAPRGCVRAAAVQHRFIDVAVQQSLSNPLVPQFWAQCAAFLLRLSPWKRAMPAQARSCASTIAGDWRSDRASERTAHKVWLEVRVLPGQPPTAAVRLIAVASRRNDRLNEIQSTPRSGPTVDPTQGQSGRAAMRLSCQPGRTTTLGILGALVARTTSATFRQLC